MLQDQLKRVRARKVALYYPTQTETEEKKRRRRCLGAPFWTCCCVASSLLVIGAVIVLSLIPIFISSSSSSGTTSADDDTRALVDLGYGLNLTNMSALTNEQLRAFATQLETLLKLNNKVDGSVQIQVETSRSLRAVTIVSNQYRSSQCQDQSMGRLRVRCYVRVPRNCPSVGCRNRARQSLLEDIENAYNTIFLSWSSDGSGSSAALSLCSATVSDYARVTVATTSAPVTDSDYVVPTSTAAPGRRKRAASSLIRSAPQHSHMPVAGCLLIADQNKKRRVVKDLQSKFGMMRYFPQGIEVLPTLSEENDSDLNTLLQEKKISKQVYNQILLADHSNNRTSLSRELLTRLQSHYRAWERVLQLNEPMLVLEENVHIDGLLFNTMFPYLMYALPSNFSLFYFGQPLERDAEEKLIDYNELLWKINGSMWSQAPYIISPQGAAILIDSIYPLEKEINAMINQIAQAQPFDAYMSKQIFVEKARKLPEHLPTNKARRQSSPAIPTIFHFIWLNNQTLPKDTQSYIQLWQDLHPSWTVQIWTKEGLAEQNFTLTNQEFFENSMKNVRQASDILRYEVIHRYGGVYVDLDFEPLQNIEALLDGIQAFVAYESESHICNGIFGATPQHPLTERLIKNVKMNWIEHRNGTTSQQTGPHFLTRQVKAMKAEKRAMTKDALQMFAQHLFFPYTALEKDPGRPYDSSSFAVHHFRPINDAEWFQQKH